MQYFVENVLNTEPLCEIPLAPRLERLEREREREREDVVCSTMADCSQMAETQISPLRISLINSLLK